MTPSERREALESPRGIIDAEFFKLAGRKPDIRRLYFNGARELKISS